MDDTRAGEGTEYPCEPGSSNGQPQSADGEPWVKVPTTAIGDLADRGRPSVAGLHLHAIALAELRRRPAGFALNKIHVAREYGVGWRAFAEGVRIRQIAGLVVRTRHGRNYATEEILPPRGAAFIRLPERVLTMRSSVVAFAMLALVSPRWQRPEHVGKRLGITSPTTLRQIVAELVSAGILARDDDEDGATVVARPTTPNLAIERGVKNGVVKNGVVKIGVVHKKMEGSTLQKREDHPHQSTAADAVGGGRADEVGRYPLVLAPWTASTDLRQFGLSATPAVKEISLADWNNMLDAAGGAPAHLRTSVALRQVSEIIGSVLLISANETDGTSYWLRRAAFGGVASMICQWCRNSDSPMRSLGVIAKHLLGQARYGYDSWYLAHPSPAVDPRRTELLTLAQTLADRATVRGLSLNMRSLLCTPALEELADLERRFGAGTLLEAAGESRQDQDSRVIGWAFFKDAAAEAARRQYNRDLARRRRR